MHPKKEGWSKYYGFGDERHIHHLVLYINELLQRLICKQETGLYW